MSGRSRRTRGSGFGSAVTVDWKCRGSGKSRTSAGSRGSGRSLDGPLGSGNTGSWISGSIANSGGETMGDAADAGSRVSGDAADRGGGVMGNSGGGELVSLEKLELDEHGNQK